MSARDLEQQFSELEEEAINARRNEGFDLDEIDTRRWLDLRYKGQGYELSIEVEQDGKVEKDALKARFHRTHENRYGHRGDEPLEIVTFRVASTVPVEPPAMASARKVNAIGETPAPDSTRQVYDLESATFCETPIYGRTGLAGSELEGPVIIEQLDTTILIESGQRAQFDEYGNATIEVN